ncbi:hypothetical protein [Streptomyces sp. NPDC057238]|uniref:hypothetical protein n=1 Tax=Streptomyces sp. NPDC057238 TaxID=3346060 RepID=UPI003627FE96
MTEGVAPHDTRLRNALSAALLTLTCLLTPCGTLAAWAAALADTGHYVDTVAPLATDPAVRDAVADAVGDEVVRELDAETVDTTPLGPFIREAVRSFTRTDAFRTAWEAGNRAVHDAVLHALRDDAAAPGPVTVDLAPVTAQVRARLAADHLPFAHRIPVEHTEVAVVQAGEVAGLRKGYRVLDAAAFWLPLAAVVLAVTGIAVAARRRRALTATGLGTALGGALLALAIAVGRRLTLADLPERVHRPAAGAVYDALTATLRTASWLLLALGLTVALASWLTGRHGSRREPPPLTTTRHAPSSVRKNPGIAPASGRPERWTLRLPTRQSPGTGRGGRGDGGGSAPGARGCCSPG